MIVERVRQAADHMRDIEDQTRAQLKVAEARAKAAEARALSAEEWLTRLYDVITDEFGVDSRSE